MKLFICCTLALLFAIAAGQSVITCSDTLTAGILTATFSADGDNVTFTVSAATTGWVAIGFSNDRFMINSDIVLGASNGTTGFINDRFATARAPPPVDSSQDIQETSVDFVDGTTSITFTRPLVTTDPNDITLDQCRFYLWAWGGNVNDFGNPNSISRHSSRGSFSDMICIPTTCVNGVVTCPPLPDPENGAVNDSNREFQATATYTCSPGFVLLSNDTRTCQADGTWSGDTPTCFNTSLVDCGTLGSPMNGNITLPSTGFGAIATYTCDEGFVLVGDQTRTCQLTGEWSGEEPTCALPGGAGLTQSSMVATALFAIVGSVAVLKL